MKATWQRARRGAVSGVRVRRGEIKMLMIQLMSHKIKIGDAKWMKEEGITRDKEKTSGRRARVRGAREKWRADLCWLLLWGSDPRWFDVVATIAPTILQSEKDVGGRVVSHTHTHIGKWKRESKRE
jgi:hypothetical protein